MVPDVAAEADPETGYEIVVHGAATVVGGTSAVAPPYAGLFAAFGRKLGFVTPTLWANQVAFNDVTHGDNGYYRARIGPDSCTGLGSPIGAKLAVLFVASAPVIAASAVSTNLVPPDWSGTVRISFRNGRPLGAPELVPEITRETSVASPSRKSSRQSRRKVDR